ncbi:MAG: Acetyltransferase, GNAT family, partial [uncultured Thermomicrobiales bacterium]
ARSRPEHAADRPPGHVGRHPGGHPHLQRGHRRPPRHPGDGGADRGRADGLAGRAGTAPPGAGRRAGGDRRRLGVAQPVQPAPGLRPRRRPVGLRRAGGAGRRGGERAAGGARCRGAAAWLPQAGPGRLPEQRGGAAALPPVRLPRGGGLPGARPARWPVGGRRRDGAAARRRAGRGGARRV